MATSSGCLFIFIVGAVSGMIYVNAYQWILQDERLTEKEQEISLG
jgi:hypothetical protein